MNGTELRHSNHKAITRDVSSFGRALDIKGRPWSRRFLFQLHQWLAVIWSWQDLGRAAAYFRNVLIVLKNSLRRPSPPVKVKYRWGSALKLKFTNKYKVSCSRECWTQWIFRYQSFTHNILKVAIQEKAADRQPSIPCRHSRVTR